MSGPSVSVCVPTYNGAAFIAQTIQSVLDQSFSDFELIIVDDASTDGSAEVIAGFKDGRLRYIRHEQNQGAAATWNHAVSLAEAPLVKLLCHDDTITPDCLGRQVEVMNDPAVALVGCWRSVISPAGKTIMVRRGMKQGRFDRRAAVRAFVRSGTNLIGEPSATLFRKADWEAVGGFNAGNLYMIDVDLWLRLLKHGQLAMVPAALSTFRVSGGSLSTVLARKQVAAGSEFLRTLAKDPTNGVSSFDVRLGIARATVRSWGRQAIYWFIPKA
jgi:glycosyltransferase involved in cell wall biosynthesis